MRYATVAVSDAERNRMTPQEFTDYFGKLQAKGRATKNVMSPLHYFTWPVASTCVVSLIFGPTEYRLVFLVLFLVCVAAFFGFYGYWTFKDPSRLQSEEHTETMTVLTASMQDNRGALVDITPTANTAMATGTVAHSAAAAALRISPAIPSTVNPGGQHTSPSGGNP